ncbi:MAG TPA: FMN-binding protein [Anaerohalosphaeraceae bacterium]|jgi:electron transport complex protein RnfG|nr:FMN-binding protein [Anaerohalosphaeraceae bacterium]HRT50669.1 FMN-binding protein [Anaerohalosphaeraceae bacterium]HRT86651.1 FMN-binding protein [Anaerohalosphaeraceae bacterium]
MHKHVRHFLEQSWLLLIATVLFGTVLASLDAAWRPRILQNEVDKFDRLAGAMLTEATQFKTEVEDMQIEGDKGKILLTDVKRALNAEGQPVGWAFIAEGAGFADKIRLVVTTDADFTTFRGFDVLFSNETPGFGDKIKAADFRKQFMGVPTTELTLSKAGDRSKIDDEIVAITGATVTSEAVVKLLNRFVNQVKTQLKEKGLIQNG